MYEITLSDLFHVPYYASSDLFLDIFVSKRLLAFLCLFEIRPYHIYKNYSRV